MRRHTTTTFVHVALIAGAALTLTPLLWMVSASFMPTGQANTFPPRLLPDHATIEHYTQLFVRLNLARAFVNSAIVSVIATLGALIVTGMSGYAFAKLRFHGRDRLFHILMMAMVVPSQVSMLPLFLLLRKMGLVNSLAGVVIPFLCPAFGIFMIRQFALSIPDDLLDAARIDGGSELRIFRAIVLPLLQPILVTQALFTFLSSWNEFLWPLITLSDSHKWTLPVALANMVGEHVQDTELMMAGSVLTVLPVMAVFLFLQRAYLRGVMMGSVKG